MVPKINEPKRQKTYFRTCAPSEDSDQSAHSYRLISIFSGHIWIAKGAKFLHANNEDSDQTARMPRLIRVLLGAYVRRYVFSHWGSNALSLFRHVSLIWTRPAASVCYNLQVGFQRSLNYHDIWLYRVPWCYNMSLDSNPQYFFRYYRRPSDLRITKTCLNSFDPLKPHFYIVKLGFTGVYIIFLISAQNIDCGYSLEPPRRGGSNEYP